jgi:UDP-glucuronate 4-epimerase
MPSARVILLTGAAGFIGSHVAAALLARGDRVVGLDNFDPFYPEPIKRAAVARLEALPGSAERFRFLAGDITSPADLDRAMTGVGLGPVREIIHLAAKAGVRPSIAAPADYAHVNVTGTACVLDAATRHKAERIVMASSSSVYGNAPEVPFHEEMDVSRPISPYAATKRASELLAATHHHLTGMPTGLLRFFTVFGPGQRPDLAIQLFLSRALRGEPLTVFGSGASSRDYTFIDDIVAGVVASLDRIERFGLRTWNLGHSHPVSLDEMVSTIADVARSLGAPAVKIERGPARAGDVERTFADISRARAELGFEPATTFRAGVEAQARAILAGASGVNMGDQYPVIHTPSTGTGTRSR